LGWELLCQKVLRLLKNYFLGLESVFPERRINSLEDARKSKRGVSGTFSTVSFSFWMREEKWSEPLN